MATGSGLFSEGRECLVHGLGGRVQRRLEDPGSPSKDDNCDRSAERYDSISDLAQLVIAGFVHQQGHPINQQPNAGFSRRREVGPSGEDSGPSVGAWSWREKASARQSSMSMRLLPSGLIVACPPPRQSRAAGVGQFIEAFGSSVLPAPADPRWSAAIGVGHCAAADGSIRSPFDPA